MLILKEWKVILQIFVGFCEFIKKEDIKEEINDGESVDDPLTIPREIENSYVCEDIKGEINEKETFEWIGDR